MTDRAQTRISALTLFWSLFAAAFGLRWVIDTAAYPFGANDSRPGGGSLLAFVDVRVGAIVLLTLGVLGVAAALSSRWSVRSPWWWPCSPGRCAASGAR